MIWLVVRFPAAQPRMVSIQPRVDHEFLLDFPLSCTLKSLTLLVYFDLCVHRSLIKGGLGWGKKYLAHQS